MMQAEKVAEDLRATLDSVSGPQSPVPPLSTAVRRLERRAAQAPALIEPVVKAIDAALKALDEARSHLEQALRVARIRSARSSSGSRSGCSRCAPPPANTMCRSKIWPRSRTAIEADLALINAGAERLTALERRRKRPRRVTARRRRRCPPAAAAPRESSTRRSTPNLAAQAGAGAIYHPDRQRERRPGTAWKGSSSGCAPIPAPGRDR